MGAPERAWLASSQGALTDRPGCFSYLVSGSATGDTRRFEGAHGEVAFNGSASLTSESGGVFGDTVTGMIASSRRRQ